MLVNDFIQSRQNDWQQLQNLLDKQHTGGGLSVAEARELGQLYRAVISDLALARRDYPGQRVVAYLNQLLTKAHSGIYQQERNDFRAALRYFTHTIPQVFRETWAFTLVAFLLFLVPALVGFSLAATNPDIAGTFGLERQRETLADQSTWTNIPVEQRPYASAFITQNNIRVAIIAFGGGVTFGLFTVYILIFNGLTIGAVLGLAAHYNMADVLVDFIFAHGVVELSVIFVSGGAGLQLGWALFNPGPYTRADALKVAARRMVAPVILAVPLLIGSGIIEGFLSPSQRPFALKALVGLAYGALMWGYLLLAGRTPRRIIKPVRMMANQTG